MTRPDINIEPVHEYDPKRYYDMLLLVRHAYRNGGEEEMRFKHFILPLIQWTLFFSIWALAAVYKLWLFLALVIAWAASLFIRKIVILESDNDKTENWITQSIMAGGFTRSDATEFLYDIDWDDIQYEEPHLEYLKEKADNA